MAETGISVSVPRSRGGLVSAANRARSNSAGRAKGVIVWVLGKGVTISDRNGNRA